MGRPSYNPNADERAEIARWHQAKVSITEIARRKGVSPKTLRVACPEELELNRVETVITPRTPAFQPTTEQRQSVLIMAGAHGDEDRMARSLGITAAQLNEYFADELRDGPAIGWRKLAEAAFNGMVAGSASHLKVWSILNLQEPKQVEFQPAANGMQGKKAAAAIAARTAEAGTGWEELVGTKSVN